MEWINRRNEIECLMFVLTGTMSDDGLLVLVNSVFCLDHVVHLLVLASYSDDIANEVIILLRVPILRNT